MTKLLATWRAVIFSFYLISLLFTILCMLNDSYNTVGVNDSLQVHIRNPSLSQIICLAKSQITEKIHVEELSVCCSQYCCGFLSEIFPCSPMFVSSDQSKSTAGKEVVTFSWEVLGDSREELFCAATAAVLATVTRVNFSLLEWDFSPKSSKNRL